MTKEKTIKYCDNIIEWGFYSLLIFVTFSISLVDIAAACVISAWIIKKCIDRDLKIVKSLPVIVLSVYVAWVFLSCFNSLYWKESLHGIFKVLKVSLLFIVTASELNKKKVVKRSLYVIVVSVIITGFNGLYQYMNGVDLIRHRTLTPLDHLRRISSSFVHPNSFGIYLFVVCIIIAAFVFSKNIKLKNRMLLIPPFLLSLWCLFLTGSRGAWFSLIISGFTFSLVRSKKWLIIFLCTIVLIFAVIPASVQSRITDVFDLSSGTSWERIMLWKGAVKMIEVHPVLGFGINTYSKNFPAYKPEGYVDLRYSHNCYLQMASEIGIPGTLFFLLFLISVFVFIYKRIRRMDEGYNKDMLTGLFCALIGFSFGAATDTHLYSVVLAVFFYILLGFSFSLARHETK